MFYFEDQINIKVDKPPCAVLLLLYLGFPQMQDKFKAEGTTDLIISGISRRLRLVFLQTRRN